MSQRAEARRTIASAQMVAEIGIAVALALLLRYLARLVPFLNLPQGGAISLEMIPVLVVAFRHGVVPGVTTGVVFGLLDWFLEPATAIAHPIQFVLDFPVAFGLLGVAGFFRGTQEWMIDAGTITAGFVRFLAHYVSGIVFFASYAPEGQPVWLYSLLYNGYYMLPSTILALLFVYRLVRALERAKI